MTINRKKYFPEMKKGKGFLITIFALDGHVQNSPVPFEKILDFTRADAFR